MRALILSVTLAAAGIVGAAPPEPEPKSLGEVARRAREKREREAAAKKAKSEAQTYTNEDLAAAKKANTSSLSLPAGTDGPVVATEASSGGELAPGGASGEAQSSPMLAAAIVELERARADLAAAESEIAESKKLLDPFSTLFTPDVLRQNEAVFKIQKAQERADALKPQIAQIEARVAELRRKAEIDAMGSGPVGSEESSGSEGSDSERPR